MVKLSTSLGKRSNLGVPMKKKSKTSSIQLHHEGVDLPLLQPLPNYAVYESNAEEILFPLKRVMVRCFVKAPWHLVVNLWFVFGSTPTPPSQITTLKHFQHFSSAQNDCCQRVCNLTTTFHGYDGTGCLGFSHWPLNLIT